MEYIPNFIRIKNAIEYSNIIQNSSQPILLIFCADWSGSSHMLLALLKENNQQILESVSKIITVEFDKNEELKQIFKVNVVPTSILTLNSKVLHLFKELFSLKELIEKINEVKINITK